MCATRVVPFAFRYQRNGATPCQYIDTTRKAIDCATTLPLRVFGRPFVKRYALCYRSVVLSLCQRQSCSAINFLSSGINILAGGSSVPLISERKGTASNICTKNYWNQTTIVEIIDGGWAVYFFETQCTLRHFAKAGPVV